MELQAKSNADWLSSSWTRSSDAGLTERTKPEHIQMPAGLLRERQSKTTVLREAVESSALPLFNQMFAHTDSRLILSDKDGVIIGSWGQERFREKLTSIALSAGACWQERLKGTNAIGTALVEQRPVSVIGDQHYIRQHRFISCSASPLYDHKGQLLGVLDITSEQSQHDMATQLLVQNMVQVVENQLLNSVPHGSVRIDLSLSKETLQSGWQGIVIADRNGQILAHNQVASRLLNTQALRGHQLESILDTGHKLHMTKQSLTRKRAKTRTVSASCELHHGDHRIETAWQQANKVLGKDIPLLILGETGVGKGQFVKALHRASGRRQEPLVTVNCGALAKDLIESELFGYAPGAFTGASAKGYDGRVRQADKGILFLDEIGEMPPAAQCRLLHVLQDKEVAPVGGAQSIKVDIQFVAATHQNLEEAVAQGRFREDLYYRLNGLVIDIPPLRERKDQKSLIEAIHQQYSQGEQSISEALLEKLMAYHWPGNLRELDNLLKVTSLISGDEEELCLSHIPTSHSKNLQQSQVKQGQSINLKHTVDETLINTFNANRQNVSKTARVLGISRNTIYRKLRALGVMK